jgi:hypothetical protein
LVVTLAGLTGCGERSASLSDTSTIAPPMFAPAPAAPIDSPQLDAIVLRDTSGLDATEPDADPRLIGRALDAVRAQYPSVDYVADIYAFDDTCYLTIPDPDGPGRIISVYYRDSDDRLWFGEPTFNERTAFYPIDAVRPDAITALVDGLIAEYPTLQVGLPRLDVALSYDLGLSWRIELNDARGSLATIWADLDGQVIAVDSEVS